ncbi:MAG: PDZ domain-containing protein [Thermoguttaceae bacterium]
MRLLARVATIAAILAAWARSLAPASASEPAEATSKAAVRASFKFDPEDEILSVPVHVGTQDYRFVLDTGMSFGCFDVSLRSHLGPCVGSTRVVVPTGDEVKLELYTPPNARIGSLPLTGHPVLCNDLAPIREASGHGLYGFVGMDFLKDRTIAIDFDEGRLDVLPPGTEGDPKWGEKIPFEYNANGIMLVSVTVGKDVRTPFEVDTGDTGTGRLDYSLFSRLAGSHELRVTGDTDTMTLPGVGSPRVARLSHLSLGPFRHENLRFASSKQNALGLKYLSRYRVTIDFPNQRLYLAKGKRFSDHDRGSTCGLSLLFKPGALAVEKVDEKGPAQLAGVLAGDVITHLCGKPISALKPSEISRLLKAEDKAVQMTLQRGGKTMEVAFTPKEYD